MLPLPPLAVRVHPDRPASTGLGWLSTRGSRIVNQQGKTLILRGFNDDELLQTGRQPLPPRLSAADARLMESEGFDVVRLPISWSLLEPRPGNFSTAYLDRIRAVVNMLGRDGIYTVLDMHTEDFGVAFGGSGAPRWLYLPGVPDWHVPGLQPAWQRHLSPAVNAALAFFWLYPNWQRLYWQAWRKVAKLFRNDSALAGYDLYNEPHPLPLPPAVFDTRLLFPFYAQGIRQISRIDPNHLFILEGDLFGGLPTAVRPLHAADVVWSSHLYVGSLLPPAYTGNPKPLQRELRQSLREAGQVPAPYWTGELGISHGSRIAKSWARAEISLSNRYLTGWAWWEWDDPDGWGVRQNGGPIDLGWLHTLAQPYVRSSPGRLRKMSYSVRRRLLKATVSAASAGAQVTVAWPRWLGPPRVMSGCVQAISPYRPRSGQLRLRLKSRSCALRIAASAS